MVWLVDLLVAEADCGRFFRLVEGRRPHRVHFALSKTRLCRLVAATFSKYIVLIFALIYMFLTI